MRRAERPARPRPPLHAWSLSWRKILPNLNATKIKARWAGHDTPSPCWQLARSQALVSCISPLICPRADTKSYRTQGLERSRVFHNITNSPPGTRTRCTSRNVADEAIQWKLWAAISARAEEPGRGISSAMPARNGRMGTGRQRRGTGRFNHRATGYLMRGVSRATAHVGPLARLHADNKNIIALL